MQMMNEILFFSAVFHLHEQASRSLVFSDGADQGSRTQNGEIPNALGYLVSETIGLPPAYMQQVRPPFTINKNPSDLLTTWW